ncbi:hypothetical protein Mal65_17400 [Crateriforma conspicua]|nr:hypothetical protein Mal65_17400 [Crateriforma conspicua]
MPNRDEPKFWFARYFLRRDRYTDSDSEGAELGACGEPIRGHFL